MKVLFVSSSRKGKGISPFIKSQRDSLVKNGVNITTFLMDGSGAINYFKSIFKIRKLLIKGDFDLIHAHYNLTAIIAFFAKTGLKKRIVVSLMGDDLYGTYSINNKLTFKGRINILLAKTFIPNYDYIIVKSKRMKGLVNSKFHNKLKVVPNGVDFKVFNPIDYDEARKKLNIERKPKVILFLNNVNDPRKNYELFKQSISLLKSKINTLVPYPVKQTEVPIYLSAADVLVHCSKMEGSSNLIKEAIACNCPIVSTDVGDAKENFEGIDGCYIADFSPDFFSDKIELALDMKTRTNGREKIGHLKLESVAETITHIYVQLLK